ncbi:uncharacterized protein VP01_210g12 [Puccinia sorghi]|uniref:OTU domain-containing protein n=1 Tax=Puccinia sorghi TaxID=27349 RepID=A0A0L6VA46_9BASI|nr:uncharacterized protein VP01_210g12 [Puccinia sorghi]
MSSVSSSNPPPPPKKFIKKLPSHIKDHVHKVLDIDSDGNCVFQAVLYCMKLGKGQENFVEVHQNLLDKLNTHGKWYVNKEIMDQQTL